jgi:hypothetical protein
MAIAGHDLPASSIHHLKTSLEMKKTPVLLTVLMAATIMISCEKEKKNTIHNNIIVPPRQEVVVDTIIHQMNPIDQTDQVKWLGST